MTFDDGVVTIYDVANASAPGDLPIEKAYEIAE